MNKLIRAKDYQPKIFSGLYTCSDKMIELMKKAARVARTNASILVRGETGTGKELLARYLHEQSNRGQRTFSAVNCAAMSRELIASELFGHKKGAFTGAINDRKGLLQLTDKGTLFLDEIAEMPLDIQAGLLRVLQDHCFTPLGSSEVIHTDIRLISATHESLRKQVRQGNFREDLMYRVRVVPLYLPPLVERDADLEMLTWLFINKLNSKNERSISAVTPDAWHCLMDYRWPGNIRELNNVIEYAHAIGEGDVIEMEDLPPELRGEQPPDERPVDLDDHERSQIIELLNENGWKKQIVADKLGISRATLWRKMKVLQI